MPIIEGAAIIVLSGPSGGSKTFYTTNIVPQLTNCGIVSVSADHFFMKDGVYRFVKELLPKAHLSCRQQFLSNALNLNKKKLVLVVDNTNLRAAGAAFYMEYGETVGIHTELHRFVPGKGWDWDEYLKVCAERNVHNVPLGTLKNMGYQARNPDFPKWWKVRNILVNRDGSYTVNDERSGNTFFAR